jgi:hypothetical protein
MMGLRSIPCPLVLQVAMVFSCLSFSIFLSVPRQVGGQILGTKSIDNFLTYTNPEHGIGIEYPSNWQKLEGQMLDRMTSRAEKITAIVGFTAPSGLTSIFVTVSPSENKSASEFLQAEIPTLKKDHPDFKLVRSNSTTLAGLPAYMLGFSGRYNPDILVEKFGMEGLAGENVDTGILGDLMSSFGDIQQMRVVTIKNDKAYQVGYGGFGGEYSSYLPTAQKMIDSFQLLKIPVKEGSNSSVANTTAITELPTVDNTQTRAELRNMGTLLFSDLSNPFPFPPIIDFYNDKDFLEFSPSNNNSLTISNGTHSINFGNNTEILKLDGRLLDDGVGEVLFSNGTDNIVVGNKTKSLKFYNDTELLTIDAESTFMGVANSTVALIIDGTSWRYESCPPSVSCLMNNVIPFLTNIANKIFNNSSSRN